MRKLTSKRNQLHAFGTLMRVEEETASALAGAGGKQITGENFAKYSHAMLLSLQRLALDQHQDVLARLLGIAAIEAKYLMSVN